MSDLVWVAETKNIIARLNSHLNEEVFEQLLSLYLIEEDPREKLRIKNDVDSVLGVNTPLLLFSNKPMLPSPKKEEIQGEINIGKVTQGNKILYDFGLSKEELNQHMIITARSGAGKTTLIMWIIQQLLSENIPFIVFDFKLDYRHLIKTYPQLVVLKWKDLRINLFDPPPKVSFKDWKQQILNIFGHVEGIWSGSTHHLLEAIDESYREMNGKVKLEDVYKKIKGSRETTRKFQDYSSVVENRLYGILSTLGKTVNNYRTLVNMEELLKLPVILELDGLGRKEANLIVLWFFYWIYVYRRAHGMRGNLLHVLIIDEAKRVFTASEMYSQTTTEYSGIPPADLICDEIRDFGEAIIASDQEPSKVSDSLKANTYTKITSYLGNGKDISNISEAMDLNEEEREAITNLERGEWLVKLAGRYTKPFTMKSNNIPLNKDVTDEELLQQMKPVLSELIIQSNDIIQTDEQKVTLPNITENAKLLLYDVATHPFKGIVGRYKSLGISLRKSNSAKKELVQKGIVVELDIKLGARRPTKFLVPTNLGFKLMEETGHQIELWKRTGRQGFEHQLYAVLIMYGYKKLGCQAFIEKWIEDKRVDVLVVSKGNRIAVEVELGPIIHIEEKIEILSYVDELIIVVKKEEVTKANSMLKLFTKFRERVRIYSITKFLRYLSSNYRAEINGNNSIERNKSVSSPII